MKSTFPILLLVAAVSAQDVCGTTTCGAGFECIILDELPYPSFGCGQTMSTSGTVCPNGGIGAANWAQCGGIGFTGSSCCVDAPDWLCIYLNNYHYQCLQVSNSSAVTTTTIITTSLPTLTASSTLSTSTTLSNSTTSSVFPVSYTAE
ncbi:hypothetical protein B7494_g1108 [Chlorociboria aeruginascens]|nr:hypothetical protein B7494_g1108 [Chlorociboria aeruginascens]